MASGSSYPGSLDSWVDKLAGDFLTIADVNQRTSAIEKLETGPLRLNDGAVATPAYAFRSAANSGMYYVPGSLSINFAVGGALIGAFGRVASSVNYITCIASATANPAQIVPGGTDTNIALLLNTKGTGSILFDVGGALKATLDSTARFLIGHTVTTSLQTGDIALQNQSAIRGVTVAGTDTARIIGLNNANQVYIGGLNAADIVWGVALITMGGGATPTLGTIGGTGPATAAQNSWMRVIDAAGNPFWVPAWK